VSHMECPREPLVVEAVVSGCWPERTDEVLVTHAQACDVCREVAAVATLIHDEHERARFEVQVPAAGQIWWRSAIRARLESTQTAMRPLSWMHGVTAAIILGLLLAAMTVAWPLLPPLGDRVWDVAVNLFPNAQVASALASGARQMAVLGAVAVAVLVAAPLALYFALSRD
jgi:hypothetical protein